MTQRSEFSTQAGLPWRQILAVLITLAAFLLLSKLAWWQWQRAEEKTQQLQQIEQWQQQDGLPVTRLDNAELRALDGAPLSGTVRWLEPYVWLVDNQIVNGRVGYDVVIPVQATGQNSVLLVNLGWTAGMAERSELPAVAIPSAFDLQGVLRVAPKPFVLGQNIELSHSYPQRVQAALPSDLATSSKLPLSDAVFYQSASPFVPHYQPVILPPEKHRAYAVQWALLALAVLLVAAAVRRQQEPS